MVQGARTLEDRGEVLIFQSEDKMHWTHCNTITTPEIFGYMWECPDLFEIDGRGSCAYRRRALHRPTTASRMFTPAVISRCMGISAEIVHWVSSRRWTRALASTRPSPSWTAPAAFSWLDGYARRRVYQSHHGVRLAALLTVPCVLTAKDGKILRNSVPELNALHGTLRQLSVTPGVSESSRPLTCSIRPQASRLT